MSDTTALTAALVCDTSGFTPIIGKAAGKLNDLKQVAASVWNDTRTPQEQYQARLSQLSGLLKRGQIDQQTYARAVQQTNERLQAMRGSTLSGRIFEQTRTPLENYRRQLAQAQGLLKTGQLDHQTYGRYVGMLGKQFTQASGQAAGMSQAMAGLGVNMALFTNPVTAAVAAAAMFVTAVAAVGTAAVAAGVAGVKLAADYEQTEVAFTTMLGSATKARALLDDLSEFAAATPFEFPEVKDAARQLLAVGVAADQIVPTMRVIGDVASGVSKPVGELAAIYGKVKTQGRLMGEELRQLGVAGIPINRELAKVMGVAEEKVRKLGEQGKIGFPELQQAFKNLTDAGGQYAGMTAAQSQTVAGLYSTLKDNVNLSLRDIGQAITKELDLKYAVGQLIEFTGVFREEWVPQIADGIGYLKEFAVTFYELDESLGGPISQLETLVSAFSAAQQAIVDTQLAWAKLTGNKELQGAIEGIRQEKEGRNKPRKKPGELKLDQRGPDTTAQEKAVADLHSFAQDLDQQLAGIGLSGQQAKLKEFFTLASSGKIKLDASDLEEARQKLTQLEQAERNQAIADLTRDLQKQITLFGQSGNAAKLYELAQKGATAADLAAARALDQKLQALQRQKEVGDFVSDLQKRIALVGQNGDSAKFFDLQKQGADAAELAMARLLSNVLRQKEALQSVADAMRQVAVNSKLFTADLAAPFQALYADLQRLGDQLKAGKISQQQFDAARERGLHLAQQATSIFEATRTPFEKYKQDLAELQELLSRGFINEETFDRATRKGLKDLDRQGAKHPAALQKGSAEAYSAILRATEGRSKDQIEGKQLAEAAKANAILARIERRLGERGPQVHIRDK